MKTSQLVMFCAITVLITVVSCNFFGKTVQGEGPITKENREISAFKEIELDFNADVIFSQSENVSLEIEAQQNLLEHIEIENSGDVLELDTKNNARLKSDSPILIRISGPELTGLSVNGSGNIRIPEKLNTDHLLCDINGSGNIFAHEVYGGESEFEINGSGSISIVKWYGSSYSIDINGSGDVTLDKGTSDEGEVEINGSGDVDVLGLSCSEVAVEINGSGDVSVNAQQKLQVEIDGSGDVNYTGNPKLSVDKDGSGNVQKLR